jgi:hypothetical protein
MAWEKGLVPVDDAMVMAGMDSSLVHEWAPGCTVVPVIRGSVYAGGVMIGIEGPNGILITVEFEQDLSIDQMAGRILSAVGNA